MLLCTKSNSQERLKQQYNHRDAINYPNKIEVYQQYYCLTVSIILIKSKAKKYKSIFIFVTLAIKKKSQTFFDKTGKRELQKETKSQEFSKPGF